MSHTFFNNLWADAQKEFRLIVKEEKKGGSAQGNHAQLLMILTELYYKYVSIYKKMDQVYDQMVHPQKRPLVRRLLDLLIARMLEIREVMVKSELSEYFYQDEYTHWLHWIPSQLDIDIPKYYMHSRSPEWLEHQVWLEGESILKEADDREAELEAQVAADENNANKFLLLKADADEELDLTMEEAIITIQTAERARQGRARYELAKFFLDEEENQRKKKKLQKLAAEGRQTDQNKAATIIQRVIRRFLAKRRVQKLREEELEFLGMSWGPHRLRSPLKEVLDASKVHERKIELAAERRRRMQRRYHENFEEAKITIEERLRSVEAPEMAERMKWQIRTWAVDVKEKQGKFPSIPKQEHGGSKFIFCPDKLPEEVLAKAMAALAGKDKKKDKKNKAKEKAAKEKAKKAKEKAKRDKKKKGKKKAPEGVVLDPPKNFDDMVQSNIEYNKTWRRRDETMNPEQRHEDQIIIAEKRQLVGAEVREQVDIAMRAELEVIKAAIEKKKGKKGKKGKGKGKKGKGKKGKGKGKKGKGKGGKKGKKKKKGKDLTKERSFKSLHQELVRNGIIKKYPKIRLADLQGELSIINGAIRKEHEAGVMPIMPGEDLNLRFPGDPNPLPTFGDIKRAIKDICILPMGSPTVHEIAPYTKSVLIAGPEGSGKHSLVHAICTEIGATLMDLTAKNIAGLYPGKGKKAGTKLLVHMIGKVGRLCQPTVLLIDNCEKMFQKKIPKEEKKMEPKRLAKPFKKFLKQVDEEDSIILIGLTQEPWKAKAKPMKKIFQRVIYIPKPEYGSRLNWWRNTLGDYAQDLSPDIHYSLLAKLSESWTPGSIKKVVQKIAKKMGLKAISEVEAEKAKAQAEALRAITSRGGGDTGGTTDDHRMSFGSKSSTFPGQSHSHGHGHGHGHDHGHEEDQGHSHIKGPGQKQNEPPKPVDAGAGGDAVKKEKKKVITMDDILKELSQLDPIFVEMDKAWTNWFKKTPLEKQRRAGQVNISGKGKKKDGKGKKGGKDDKKGKKGKKR